MATRRGFLGGLLATGLAPVPSWADVGSPAFLSAARTNNGDFVLSGLNQVGAIKFIIPLPTRGHAAAAHPHRPEAVAFARRPGTFAVVLDCQTGTVLSRLSSPTDRHFYGHGTFDAAGDLLFTTENDYANGRGRIGIWDARNGYARIGEIASHGVGPHDVRLMPNGTLVVANGGIDTHPDTGRTKLNIATMRPNLSYVGTDGTLIEQIEPDHAKASIRHLSVRRDGVVGLAMQWQGDIGTAPPLAALHRSGEPLIYFSGATDIDGYIGSIAFSGDGEKLAVTSPRAGVAITFDMADPRSSQRFVRPDICGVAGSQGDLTLTDGLGGIWGLTQHMSPLERHDLAWDNHLISVA